MVRAVRFLNRQPPKAAVPAAAAPTPAPSPAPPVRRPKLYIDVSTLQEADYTGIAHVTAKLCEQLLGDGSVEPGFFFNRYEVSPSLIEHLLVAREGLILRWSLERFASRPILALERASAVMGLHTNIKSARRLFPVEGQIVHDLTTIVTPQHHTAETVEYCGSRFYGDLMSNDVTFAVSQSTATDVLTYFPEMRDQRVVVTHLGVDWDDLRGEPDEAYAAEPYILVLGTLEPRKNVSIVLDLLQQQPELAQQYRIVFTGRMGWGDAFETQLALRGLSSLSASHRIVQTGFLPEAAKRQLLKHARAVVYPSVYEGFGLPVAEAISLGTPAVTTPAASIPEVGGEAAHYFIPGDLGSLRTALGAALAGGRLSPEVRDGVAQRFSWRRCYETIRRELAAVASERELHVHG